MCFLACWGGGLQVVTQRNANCKPNSLRAPWSSRLFRAFVRICASLSLFYVCPLVLITVKGLRVATVFISNQWLSRTRSYRPPHLHSIEWADQQDNWHWVSLSHPNGNREFSTTFFLRPSSKKISILWLFSPHADFLTNSGPYQATWDSVLYISAWNAQNTCCRLYCYSV